MKVFVFSARPFDQQYLLEAAGESHELFFTEKKLNADTVHYADGCQAVALFTADQASAQILERLNGMGVRYVALRSVGYDHVDLKKAAELGMGVANVPEYSPYSVAEHGVAMLMALNRKVRESQLLMQLQDFRLDALMGFDVHGKTVGVIGTGNIGMAFSRIMNGFGATLLGYDPVRNDEAMNLGMKYVSWEELLEKSDIISIHCPLNEKTKYLFDKAAFAKMKSNAILINTSRGGVVHTAALIEALQQGKIQGACLDVYEREKGIFFEDHQKTILTDSELIALRGLKNVLITGHQGYLTVEALRGIAGTTMDNLSGWEVRGGAPNELVRKA